MSETLIQQYVIYDHPRDFPKHFVVRGWEVNRALNFPLPLGNPVLADTLEQARAAVPAGLINIGRFAEDDPVILEVWT